jgi:hypothetical protein
VHESAYGTKRTSGERPLMSAFGGKADMTHDRSAKKMALPPSTGHGNALPSAYPLLPRSKCAMPHVGLVVTDSDLSIGPAVRACAEKRSCRPATRATKASGTTGRRPLHRVQMSATVSTMADDQRRSNRFCSNASAAVTNSCGSLPS